MGWVYERMRTLVSTGNSKLWRYGPLGRAEVLQLALYRAAANRDAANGHYDWHVDQIPDLTARRGRIFSVTVQLSNAKSYQGGDVLLASRLASRKQGDLIVFPSHLSCGQAYFFSVSLVLGRGLTPPNLA